MTKKLIAIFAAALIGLTLTAQAAKMEKAKNGYYKQKVVYHVNNLDSANGAFRNIKNHLNALGDENADIIVVTHSSGAFALVNGHKDSKGNSFESTIDALANRGVKFEICANTIRGKKIDEKQINMHAVVVPSGVAQIIDLEQKGYYYIKP